MDDWIDTAPTPEMAALVSESRSELAKAVENLPEKNRILILMHYGAGISYEAMSTALDIPKTTIVGRLAAALRMLRRKLGD